MIALVFLGLPPARAQNERPASPPCTRPVVIDGSTVIEWGEGIPACPGTAGPGTASPALLGVDPDLEPGFPVRTLELPGTFSLDGVHVLVGNIDDDPQLEILTTALARGPLHAWNHDGTPVPGWPVAPTSWGAAYAALGQLSLGTPSLEAATAHWEDPLAAWTGAGLLMAGWPLHAANYVTGAPALADIDGDGRDEIFLNEEDHRLHGYSASGQVLPGWPVWQLAGAQSLNTPAIVDLDGDGDLEFIVSVSGSSFTHYLRGFHHDGSPIQGFPVSLRWGVFNSTPAVGDLDGDGELEIVINTVSSVPPYVHLIRILNAHGRTLRTVPLAGGASVSNPYPALADLDGDGRLEIVAQTAGAVNVIRSDGSSLNGWPVSLGAAGQDTFTGPVVGDVTGDGLPDVVVSTSFDVRVYDRFGVMDPRFPKPLQLGLAGVPAIADIDLDGRNEILVLAQYWDGHIHEYDRIWAFDLGGGRHGPILWGQFLGGPRHQGWPGQPHD